MKPGDRLTLQVEKPAAGGRMIARHDATIVLVAAAIPGETVEARVEKVHRGTIWATTTRVIEASADRLDRGEDRSCGGSVFAHIRYDRQLALKCDIIRDGFNRIGRMPLPDSVPIRGSPIDGYRMRARLHVRHGRVGFFREGSHELCDPATTRQLLPATLDSLRQLEAAIGALPRQPVAEIEVAENCAADQRAVHLDLLPETDRSRLGSLPAIAGVTGVSCGALGSHHAVTLTGSPTVTDEVRIPAANATLVVTLARHVRWFFQGNRFLLSDLVAGVIDLVPVGRVLDLYAGVGLFAAALAARGDTQVVALEGDRSAADDLKRNATKANGSIAARHQSVETFLSVEKDVRVDTVIVDPPRTGLSKQALAGVLTLEAPRLVYISCDVATLARDARLLVDAGYRMRSVRAFDLFPNTAHVESVVVFDR